MTATKTATPTLHLSRWTVTSGSQVQSRGAVVISSGEHQWKASAEGNGAVDAPVKVLWAEVRHGHGWVPPLRTRPASPSRCPIMFSVTSTGMNLCPL